MPWKRNVKVDGGRSYSLATDLAILLSSSK